MRKSPRKTAHLAVGLLLSFVLWTTLLCIVDVRTIGPRGSAVGFAAANEWVHHLTGVHLSLYTITDWLGLVPIGFAAGFALLGLVQWVKRKRLSRVDVSLFVLGGFYLVVIAAYVLFETVVINYRPVLIDGCLEVSYPSSTTLLVLCVMPTAILQFNSRIHSRPLKRWVCGSLRVFIVLMVVGRLISGVHWFTDIVGGALLSTGLVMAYRYVVGLKS